MAATARTTEVTGTPAPTSAPPASSAPGPHDDQPKGTGTEGAGSDAAASGAPGHGAWRSTQRAWDRVPESAARGRRALPRRPRGGPRRARAGAFRRRSHPPVHSRRGGPRPFRAPRMGCRLVREHRPGRLRATGSPVPAVLPGRPGADPRAGVAPWPRRRPCAGAAGQRCRAGRDRHALRPGPSRDRATRS